MVIEALHVLFRLIIYIVFTVFDFLPTIRPENTFSIPGSTDGDFNKAFNFIEEVEPYQFIWIGLSHCLILALMISLIVTMLFLRETYSYYDRDYKLIKF